MSEQPNAVYDPDVINDVEEMTDAVMSTFERAWDLATITSAVKAGIYAGIAYQQRKTEIETEANNDTGSEQLTGLPDSGGTSTGG